MTLTPGSALWLLRHELRLVWRGTGGSRLWLVVGLGGLLWLGYHVTAWSLLSFSADATLPPTLFLIFGASAWFVFTLMLSQAIAFSVSALFERGDLDLLLASPVAPRNVFLIRGLGIAIASVAIYAWLLTPFAHVGVLTGHARLLAIYPALAALAMLAAAMGMALTVALVRALGARRARTFAQVLGALVGASLFLGLQFNNLVSPERSARWIAALQRSARDGNGLDRESPLWLPLDALLGGPFALVTLVAIGVGAFAWVVTSTARRFVAGTQESTTTPVARATVRVAARFRGGLWRAVLVKEWKLIGRDPQMITHTLLQSLYLLPLVFVWMRNASPQVVLAPAMVMLSGSLASGLTWLTVSAEDAPELLASAPVQRGLLRRAKLVAGLTPVWALTVPLALVLAMSDATAAAIFTGCVAGATVSSGSLHLLLPRTGRRRDLRRRGKGNLLGNLLEMLTAVAWPALTWSLLQAPRYAPVPAAVAIAAPLVAWWLGRQRRREFCAA